MGSFSGEKTAGFTEGLPCFWKNCISGTRRARHYSMKRSCATPSSTDRKLAEKITQLQIHAILQRQRGVTWRQNWEPRVLTGHRSGGNNMRDFHGKGWSQSLVKEQGRTLTEEPPVFAQLHCRGAIDRWLHVFLVFPPLEWVSIAVPLCLSWSYILGMKICGAQLSHPLRPEAHRTRKN